MNFEYDKNKSIINKQKHGIDFEEAKRLFEDENALVVPAKIVGNEKRFALISRYWLNTLNKSANFLTFRKS